MEKIDYRQLNPRQQECFNFQKISAVLADYGYMTYRIFDDFNYADFHAVHISGEVKKVQLKGRFEILSKYLDKDLHIAFHDKMDDNWYLFPHDELYEVVVNNTEGAKRNKGRSIKNIPKWLRPILDKYSL